MDRSENVGGFSFGTFLCDGFACLPSALIDEKPHLGLGNSNPQYESAQMHWIAAGGKLFATTPIREVDWDCVHRSGVDIGQQVRVDGMRFTMRLPVFGYDMELDELGWLWGCWAQDSTAAGKRCQLWRSAIDGKTNAMWLSGNMTQKLVLYPVLKPRMPDLNVMAGLHHINMMTPAGPAKCDLKDITDYDIVCTNYEGQLDEVWSRQEGDVTFLTREVILNAGFC